MLHNMIYHYLQSISFNYGVLLTNKWDAILKDNTVLKFGRN